ncbi:hypothetical protein AnigIFM62618_006835 [Aspergillus niger]|nr:hypothetical protein AnigIFM62618_006835 [Aspergillus niger]
MGRFTGDTKDPAVNVSTWFLLVTASLSVIFRLGTKYGSFRTLTNDDYLIVVSLIFCIGQSIAVSMAVANGYGYHFSTLTPERFDNMMKSLFLEDIPFMFHPQPDAHSQRSSRRQRGANIGDRYGRDMSTGNRLSMQRTEDLELLHGEMHEPGTISHHPQVYTNKRATTLTSPTDSMALLYGNHEHCDRHHDHLAGALLDRAHPNVLETQVRVRKYLFISSPVSPLPHYPNVSPTNQTNPPNRVILISIVELILVSQNDATHDPSFSTWGVTISVETIQCLSIVTACWAQLKPFLNMLKSNGLRIQGVDYRSTNNRSKWSTTRSANRTESKYTRSGEHELVGMGAGQGNITTVSAARLSDDDSQSSQAGIIREVRTWVVSEEVET